MKIALFFLLLVSLPSFGQEAVAKLKTQYQQALGKPEANPSQIHQKYLEELRKARGLATLAKDKITEKAATEEIQATCEKIIALNVEGKDWLHSEVKGYSHPVRFLGERSFTLNGGTFKYAVLDESSISMITTHHQFRYKFNWDFTRADGAIVGGPGTGTKLILTNRGPLNPPKPAISKKEAAPAIVKPALPPADLEDFLIKNDWVFFNQGYSDWKPILNFRKFGSLESAPACSYVKWSMGTDNKLTITDPERTRTMVYDAANQRFRAAEEPSFYIVLKDKGVFP